MLTVLIATYNRAKTLPEVLEAFCQLKEPIGGWKLVFVDNGSTDETPEILQSYCQRLPLTILYEPRRGKNVALNTGLSSIAGDLVVFTDDDVLPRSDWLVQLRAVVDANPSFSMFGGSILPKWEIPPKEWITNLSWLHLGATFSLLDPSFKDGPIGPDYVVGSNMAVRTNIFDKGYRFDTTIGPDGSNVFAMGSEVEFTQRMTRLGFKSWHCKDAVVWHIVPVYRMNKEYALRRAVRFGRGRYSMWAKHALDSPASQRVPKYLIRLMIIGVQILVQLIRVAIAKIYGDANKIFTEQWWLNYYFGKALESKSIGIKKQHLQVSIRSKETMSS